MKAALAAALLALAAVHARAQQHDAYKSLRGLADSAAEDRGPQAGRIDGARGDERALDEKAARRFSARANGERPAATDAPERREQLRDSVSDRRPAAAPPRQEETQAPEDRAVSAPPPHAARPRLWTRLFAALLPASRPSFDAPVSTGPARRPLKPEEAAGQARGMAELMSLGAPGSR